MKSDVFWSLFAMPIGLMICFGPGLLAWIFCTDKAEEPAPVKQPAKH